MNSMPASPSPSISSASEEWSMLYTQRASSVIQNILKTSLPRSRAYQTTGATEKTGKVSCHYCKSKGCDAHFLKRQYRKCLDGVNCPVRYRVDECMRENVATIEDNEEEHSHDLAGEYDHTNGLPDQFKSAIDDILKFNHDMPPKQVRSRLINNLKMDDVPPLTQVRSYVYRKRQYLNPTNNLVQPVVEQIMSNLYFPTIRKDQPFYFGVKMNSEGTAVVGDGSELDRLYVFVTSLQLLEYANQSNQHNLGIFHSDTTYKITKNEFNLFVFGRSNLKHSFYPICLGLISHEQQVDFSSFYKAYDTLCKQFGIQAPPAFLMQDACKAQLNAAREVWPTAVILMCYFHVMKNVKDHLRACGIPMDTEKHPSPRYKMIMNDIGLLHRCTHSTQY